MRVCYVLDAKVMKAWPSLQRVAAARQCEAVTITQREQVQCPGAQVRKMPVWGKDADI